MAPEIVFSNARIVTEDEVVLGSMQLEGARIGGVSATSSALPAAVDLEGDYLIPGLIELHTDNLEKHYSPRAGVQWDAVAAAVGHDVQITGSGITTVYDSLVLGAAPGWDARDEWLVPMLAGLAEARRLGMLKAEHRLHWRCEVTHAEIVALFESLAAEPGLGLISLMDHAPGDRQSPDIEAYKRRYRAAASVDDAAVEAHVASLIEGSRRYGSDNRRQLCAMAATKNIPVASHDDARLEHIEEAAALGCVISEFPTTLEAAVAARRAGMQVLMGAPNLIRGSSHSGNVAAAELAREDQLDIISSDYIPAALLPAAFRLASDAFGYSLSRAIATVSANPARAAGLDDRGRIGQGMRADLVRVALRDGRPLVREVWVAGAREA
ncbi:alpha-D-ribose 1-methylphosphonate 5-triphosphate diphosphatase [Arboricoccus pini]|uniref:Alpha-D-ribose 1-methylphosphonate 5-triphosphate diphosphatase n=1 Tax=Arboricoccus pini TaxID=1963835 RepID=A0A212QQD8_9PROT|nr:alpha-D-ribose 1-methylphosphonate 5-triphosphate diphosphatase [Arboricoccus pini]SNB61692.1 alpha-D-ribose 1-methylphosphonate 5-triphosphate diphosphatase [Arboricoccus pini]